MCQDILNIRAALRVIEILIRQEDVRLIQNIGELAEVMARAGEIAARLLSEKTGGVS